LPTVTDVEGPLVADDDEERKAGAAPSAPVEIEARRVRRTSAATVPTSNNVSPRFLGL
jgi:hypothetical protein